MHTDRNPDQDFVFCTSTQPSRYVGRHRKQPRLWLALLGWTATAAIIVAIMILGYTAFTHWNFPALFEGR